MYSVIGVALFPRPLRDLMVSQLLCNEIEDRVRPIVIFLAIRPIPNPRHIKKNLTLGRNLISPNIRLKPDIRL